MLDRSHRVWKYGAIIGATVVAPTIYLIVNEWKAESLPFACWVVIGFAVGWDLAGMIAGKSRGGGKRRVLQSHVLRNERTNRVGVTNDRFDEDQEATRSLIQSGDPDMPRQRTLGEQLGYRYFDRYDGYEAPLRIDEY